MVVTLFKYCCTFVYKFKFFFACPHTSLKVLWELVLIFSLQLPVTFLKNGRADGSNPVSRATSSSTEPTSRRKGSVKKCKGTISSSTTSKSLDVGGVVAKQFSRMQSCTPGKLTRGFFLSEFNIRQIEHLSRYHLFVSSLHYNFSRPSLCRLFNFPSPSRLGSERDEATFPDWI